MVAGKCLNRGESLAMNTTTRSLIVMNYFPDYPSIIGACRENSAPLMDMLNTCYEAAGKRWPNFIVVDFYKKSDGGGAPEAVDKANGQLICARPDILSCRVIQGGGVRTEL
ncbi:OLC1v1000084C5 [Oldenlandia corymbosa var. corymbosa]|nr:OLC1v1000084C2 [Oldenlandia corymbosa var. corymbosa]CAI9101921.1 OLC1v1000084C5 [Oldenlandia corymbosa var. corymbosa]